MDELTLAKKLKDYPELRERFEQLVAIVENNDNETTLADVAEERVIEEVRQLGHDALENWAKRRSEKASLQVKTKMKKARKNTKKNSAGTQHSEQ